MTYAVDSLASSRHGTWVEIRLSRLLQNLKTLKTFGRPDTAVLAVVKANAYGHGLLPISQALKEHVDYFGVSSLREAMALREKDPALPVLVFGRLFSEELPVAIEHDLTLSLSSLEEAEEVSAVSRSLGRKTTVHIKVDTGMGRLGIACRQARGIIEKISALESLVLEGLYTHFPTAEKEDGFAQGQLQSFEKLILALQERNITFRYRHAANSAGIVKTAHPALNLLRPGLSLYGIYPDAALEDQIALAPILSLKSKLISVKKLGAGESCGYGRTFVAAQPTTIGILPVGYSHGYPFQASNRASVLYQGRRYPLAGRVSMDYLAVDFGTTAVRAWEEITLIGESQNAKIRVEELAAWSNTIPYEIVTRLLPSLPRYYA